MAGLLAVEGLLLWRMVVGLRALVAMIVKVTLLWHPSSEQAPPCAPGQHHAVVRLRVGSCAAPLRRSSMRMVVEVVGGG